MAERGHRSFSRRMEHVEVYIDGSDGSICIAQGPVDEVRIIALSPDQVEAVAKWLLDAKESTASEQGIASDGASEFVL